MIDQHGCGVGDGLEKQTESVGIMTTHSRGNEIGSVFFCENTKKNELKGHVNNKVSNRRTSSNSL